MKSAYALLDPVVRLLLQSPFHGVLSSNTLLISFRGRRSGKAYTTPVSYLRDGSRVACFTTARNWWRNLLGGSQVSVVIQGKRLEATAEAIVDDDRVAEGLMEFFVKVPRDAGRYGVGLGDDGTPNEDDVGRAAKRTVMVVLELEKGR